MFSKFQTITYYSFWCQSMYRWKEKDESESHSVVSNSLQPHGLCSLWNSPGQNTGVGSLSLIQGIFSTPGIEPRSPSVQVDSLPAEPQGKPLGMEGNMKIIQTPSPANSGPPQNSLVLHFTKGQISSHCSLIVKRTIIIRRFRNMQYTDILGNNVLA